jgi:hypothetical protein
MFIMVDSQLYISKKIYDFQLELVYWDNYINGLNEFLKTEKLTKLKKEKISHEITRVNFHKHKRELYFKAYLSEHRFSTENKLKYQYKN